MHIMKLKVAVFGAGRNGSCFIENYGNNPHVGEVVIVEPNPKLREHFRTFPKVVKTCAQVEQFLEGDGADVISIHTPSDLHPAHFIQAAARGAHVFVEKPLANTQADVEAMLAAAGKNKSRKMMAGQNYRLESYNPQVKRLIDDGAIGRPVCLHMGYVTDYVYAWQTEPVTMYGNLEAFARRVRPMIEGACHLIDLANWLTGAHPVTVFSRKRAMQADRCPTDWMAGIFHYSDQTLVHMDACWAAIGPIKEQYGTEVYGTEGTIRDGRLFRYKSKEYHLRSFEERPLDPVQRKVHSFDLEAASFIEAIVEDKPVPVTLAEGANAAIGAIAAEESARLEQMVQVPYYSGNDGT
jgi:predicted dehydrogenase